jgi:hypothetical protein
MASLINLQTNFASCVTAGLIKSLILLKSYMIIDVYMSPCLNTMYEYFNNYVITKCLLSCDVLLMLIGSRQYTVLFSLTYWIELNRLYM